MKRLIILIFFYSSLLGHGFGAFTKVALAFQSAKVINYLCKNHREKVKVISYNTTTYKECTQLIKRRGYSKVNCHIRMCVSSSNQESKEEIICTPTQEFYCADTRQWIPAYKLQVGAKLLCRHELIASVLHVQLINNLLPVYTLQITKTHTFYVGSHELLTHNMVLPIAFTFAVNVPLGSSVGGAAGACAGPVTACIGAAVGAFVGFVAAKIQSNKATEYEVRLGNNSYFDRYIEQNKPIIHEIPPDLYAIKNDGCFELQPQTATHTVISLRHPQPFDEPSGFYNASQDSIFNATCHYTQKQIDKNDAQKAKTRYDGFKAENIHKWFREHPLGQKYKSNFKNIGKQNRDGAPLYRITEDIPGAPAFKKGYDICVDRLHHDHFEVWNGEKFEGVANMDGTWNLKKTEQAVNKKSTRNLPDK